MLLGVADRMAGEEVVCPRCGQRVLTPADRRPPEPALPPHAEREDNVDVTLRVRLGDRPPPPLPRRSIFPEKPVVLEPPELEVRVGEPVREPKEPPPRKPWQARFVAFFLLVGGAWAFVHLTVFVVKLNGLCCLWPGMLLEVGWGLAALVRGAMLLFAGGRPRAPAVIVILQVLIGSAAFDLVNTLLGVLNVLLVCAPASRRYYRNEWGEHEDNPSPKAGGEKFGSPSRFRGGG